MDFSSKSSYPMHYLVIGQALLWIGFLIAALTTVFRLEVADDPWSTIHWPAYIVSLTVGAIGVVALRLRRAQQQRHVTAHNSGLEAAISQLQLCADQLDGLLTSQIENLSCEQVLELIDQQITPLLDDFADRRMAIRNVLGNTVYSAVMTEFASGQRYTNRAWSAAADGYVDEVHKCVHHASQFLRAAVRCVKQ
ncbi:MAG: hypothetical protein KF752_16915 [Pirellulaceae bacterium]|nr:hypothetical protein [Pirellulaceae bacterium]